MKEAIHRELIRTNLRIRALRAEIDANNKSTAIHEAAHAVIAVHLRLGFAHARLRRLKDADFLVITGGHITLKSDRHPERQIIMTCAGLEAEKLFTRKPTPSFLREIADDATSDERGIKRLCKAHHIDDVERLRRKAATLVRVHRRAIRAVSRELLRAGDAKVSARTIKSIYLSKSRVQASRTCTVIQ